MILSFSTGYVLLNQDLYDGTAGWQECTVCYIRNGCSECVDDSCLNVHCGESRPQDPAAHWLCWHVLYHYIAHHLSCLCTGTKSLHCHWIWNVYKYVHRTFLSWTVDLKTKSEICWLFCMPYILCSRELICGCPMSAFCWLSCLLWCLQLDLAPSLGFWCQSCSTSRHEGQQQVWQFGSTGLLTSLLELASCHCRLVDSYPSGNNIACLYISRGSWVP